MRLIARIVGSLLVLLLVFTLGIRVGANPLVLPGALQGLAGTTSDTTFNQVAKLIKDDYYRKVPDAQVQNVGAAAAIASLHDRFSSYLDPAEYRSYRKMQNPHFSGIGLNVSFSPRGLAVTRVFAGTPAAKAGIKAGETIVSVNGRPLAGNTVNRSVALVTGKPGSWVTVAVVDRAGRPRTLKVQRALIALPPVVSSLLTARNGKKVGIVALSGFIAGSGGQVATATRSLLKRGAKSIVLDLRENGGGLIDEAVAVASVFIPKGPVVTTRGRNRAEEVYKASGDAIPASVPVVVLVDRNTASASEIVAGAIQDTHRGIVVGTRTFGKGIFQEMTPLTNNGALEITVGQYFLPSGRNLGGRGIHTGAGIKPDLPIAPSAGSFAAFKAAVDRAAGKSSK